MTALSDPGAAYGCGERAAMARRVEAIVEGPLLVWARETNGLDLATAAERLRVTETRLRAWEASEARPSIPQLRKMAEIYRRPLAAFYLPEPPPEPKQPRDYRRLPGVVSGLESPSLHAEWRRAGYRRDLAIEWYEDDNLTPPSVTITAGLADDPEEVGSLIRSYLGVPLTTQFGWRDSYKALNGWRAAVEAGGVLAMQMTDVTSDEVRGFSLATQPVPVACVNIKEAPNGRIFTLLHEFAHIVLRQGGLCDLDDTLSRPPELLRVERYCNEVAAATLMPRRSILTDVLVAGHPIGEEWSDLQIDALSRHFSVSREAIVRRLLDLGRVDRAFYQRKREQYHHEYEESLRNRPPGFAPPARVALASVGPTFASLALTSYFTGRITSGDFSDALGVRAKQISAIAEMVGQPVS